MCAFKAKKTCIVYVIASEKTILLSAMVRSQECCIKININLCSSANKKPINNAVAPQSTMAMVLKLVSLLAIVHSKII